MCVIGNQRPSKIQIKYVKDTIAYRKGDTIYMHEDLKDYPNLHKSILDHEFKHDDKIFSIKDFFHDFKPGLPKEELKHFRRKHRDLALRMMLPINRFGVNYNLIGVYILMIGLVYLTMRGVLWIGLKLA